MCIRDRDMSRSPLFQVMLVLQNAPMGAMELEGLTLSLVDLQAKSAQFDLTMAVHPQADDGLFLRLEYATDLFDRATVERLSTHFTALLRAATNAPRTPVYACLLYTSPSPRAS